MWMRGGTSKGGYFLADDLPADPPRATPSCSRVMGSPDPRQIDGMGGADPLTRKVAVVSQSDARGRRRRLSVPAGVRRPGDRHRRAELRQHPRRRRPVRDRARAGRGDGRRDPGARSSWRTPARSRSPRVADARRPGDLCGRGARSTACRAPHAPVPLEFRDTAGSTCGALLPTGNAVDVIDGVALHADRQRHALRGDARPPTSARPATRTARALDGERRAARRGSRRSGSRPGR